MSASIIRSWFLFSVICAGVIFVAIGCAPDVATKSDHKTATADFYVSEGAIDSYGPAYDVPPADFYRDSNRSMVEARSGPVGGFPAVTKSASAKSESFKSGEAKSSPQTGAASQETAATQRKLIQNYQLQVAVKNLDDAETELRGMIEASGGFVSQSDRGSQPGQRREGRWTIRIPGNKAGDIAKSIMNLGEPIRQSSKSQDVTEEYFDLEARLKNKRVEEERLVKHLRDSTGKLEEILLVEKEIARVRGEIEQAQGRLNMLANLTSLATLQVLLAEHVDYKPEAAPTFVTRIQRTFGDSVGGLTHVLENFTLFLVALIPWIPVILIFGIPAVIGIRRAWKAVPVTPAPVAEISK